MKNLGSLIHLKSECKGVKFSVFNILKRQSLFEVGNISNQKHIVV